MKIIDDNGNEFEVSEISKVVGSGDIVLISSTFLRKEDTEELEEYYSSKFDRKVIILDERIAKVLQIN